MKGKRILVFAAIALLSTGQFSPAGGQDVKELIRDIDEQQRKIQTLTATFSQKKETSLLKDPLVSSGVIKFKRPNLIHFTYLKPEPMEVALDGKTIWIYAPGNTQAEKYSLTPGKRMTQAIEPLTSIFQNSLTQLAGRYFIAYEGLEADHLHRFRLQPREEKVQKFLFRVDLWIDKTSGAILRFRMMETNGDRLSLSFKNLQFNPALTDDDLKIKVPPSVKVLDQGGP